MKTCLKCGAEVPNDYKVCGKCGTVVDVTLSLKQSPQPLAKPNRKWVPFVGGIAGLVVLIIIIAVAVSSGKKPNEYSFTLYNNLGSDIKGYYIVPSDTSSGWGKSYGSLKNEKSRTSKVTANNGRCDVLIIVATANGEEEKLTWSYTNVGEHSSWRLSYDSYLGGHTLSPY